VQASGYRLVPITHPIGPWAILAVCSQGLLLVGVVREAWPSTMGGLWGHPASFPVNTRRLIHKWTADAPLPEALTLVRTPLPEPFTAPPARPQGVATPAPSTLC
jgi:hypothetical protein